jgi:hypothetical protein
MIDGSRKKDARQKIQLGGLVVKAGLRDADRAFLMGVLAEAAKLQPGSPEFERLVRIGRVALNTNPPPGVLTTSLAQAASTEASGTPSVGQPTDEELK